MSEAERKPQKAHARQFGVNLGGFKYTVWGLELLEDQTLDDAMEPAFYSNVIDTIVGHDKKRGIGDKIEVRQRNTGLYAELLINDVGPGFVRVTQIAKVIPAEPKLPKGPWKLGWNVGSQAHYVLRTTDHQIMATGFKTKEPAIAWIENHMKSLAA